MFIFAVNSLWHRHWTFPENGADRIQAAKGYTSRLQVRAEADEFFEEADAAWLGWDAWVHIPDQRYVASRTMQRKALERKT